MKLNRVLVMRFPHQPSRDAAEEVAGTPWLVFVGTYAYGAYASWPAAMDAARRIAA